MLQASQALRSLVLASIREHNNLAEPPYVYTEESDHHHHHLPSHIRFVDAKVRYMQALRGGPLNDPLLGQAWSDYARSRVRFR